jgi:hypothetical protein
MDKPTKDKARETSPPPAKKPYTAPSFRSESVFVTSALQCGKVDTTQGSCASSRKAS